MHMCTIWKIYTFKLYQDKSTHVSQASYHTQARQQRLPSRYTFKSSPLAFIDSNLRIVLEFWHLLILNLLTPGGPDLNITSGTYLNTHKENIPKTPWIAAIHAQKQRFNVECASQRLAAARSASRDSTNPFPTAGAGLGPAPVGFIWYEPLWALPLTWTSDSEVVKIPCRNWMSANSS